ncbi:hypothetical protein BN1325_70007 [Staphylococcus aureus]|nr:hypothetical protein BN1323_370094 [Staphylococcus aureus]CRI26665.1 hypothetical protein BN1322_80007 [Staphylococcus aureus]CRI26989.1 hypothetical protein SAET23_80007 [Staphylococcus aureus]CRI30304.1 hypothetical protein BN1325_70007 [Staphylococcus aureus]CRI30456.1 hypothetical protein SAET23_80007 [Staphylococcus aureus]
MNIHIKRYGNIVIVIVTCMPRIMTYFKGKKGVIVKLGARGVCSQKVRKVTK